MMRIENGCVRTLETTAARDVADPPAGGATPARAFGKILSNMLEAERDVDAWIDKALDSPMTNPRDLLRLQVTVHRFQMQVELAARMVAQASETLRTLMRPT